MIETVRPGESIRVLMHARLGSMTRGLKSKEEGRRH
jgi:hypothetical protein